VTGHDSNILLATKNPKSLTNLLAPTSSEFGTGAEFGAALAAIRNGGELLGAQRNRSRLRAAVGALSSALPQMLVAFDFLEGSPRQLVIRGRFRFG